MTTNPGLQAVIGLEVHAQLLTRSKMFCGCDAHYAGAEPNTHVCAICLGMPGALPVINRKAVEGTISTALALKAEVSTHSRFDRKNYQYPDIPKGYQISQYDSPIARGGWLAYQVGNGSRRCGITRVHLEEDTGKSMHTAVDGREVSLVDYNRSGVPLMEIVTEPELTSPEQARAFFETLRQLLMYLDVCDGKLQEGSMRADVNVSLRRSDGSFGDKVEIKNLNSFRSVQRALEFEIARQTAVLERGGVIEQETRGWNERDETTVSQRTKEYAHDYRYFPEPDLPGLHVTREQMRALSEALPETPAVRTDRLREECELSPYLVEVLTREKPLADYFEEVVRKTPKVSPTVVANWITGDLSRLLNESGMSVESVPFPSASLASLLSLVDTGAISGAAGKQVLEKMYTTGKDPESIIQEEDLAAISDESAIDELVAEVLAQNEPLVTQYKAGKVKVIEALLGKVMGFSKGKAQPAVVRRVLEEKLRG